MKVYFAASLERLASVAEAAAILRAEGFEVVSTWHEDAATTPEGERVYAPSQKSLLAVQCEKELREAEIMICYYDPRARVGHVVEYGMAIALFLPIILVPLDRDERQTLFLEHPRTLKVFDWQMALSILKSCAASSD